ncbi:MAG: glycogen/starch/alpha-glucan phosphorylase [Gammaproteobacteria bacterium]|nr:glycogen/starch/alpha-glucan phosphorylase [Gammaproteobacteria bacterium]
MRHCRDKIFSMKELLDQRLVSEVGAHPSTASNQEIFRALAGVARAELSRRWVNAQARERASQARRVHYLSMEFLIGRTLDDTLSALDLRESAAAALGNHARRLEDVLATEHDPGLGNGGLGRLAACFLDSLATLGVPAIGYGIRYEYGMFRQQIEAGRQVEYPDVWLADGNPWEFPRPALDRIVSFGGRVEMHGERATWLPESSVLAKAYDLIVPGHGSEDVATLRLWRAAAPERFDLAATGGGDFARAAAVKNEFEKISWVLYPNDSTAAGRELRLRQEYFFAAASLHDIFARHLAEHGSLERLAEHTAIHLNDTHPAIAVAESMRLLCDVHGLGWDEAWATTVRLFSYTNHTLMQEALESWPVELVERLLPRHMQIIRHVDSALRALATRRRPHDVEFASNVSLIDERHEPRVRMAHLSVVGSHHINGVSALHSDLMTRTVFADLAELFPARFTNVTNGVTPRRWLADANPSLARLLDARIGKGWRVDLDRLSALAALADDQHFLHEFTAIKAANKRRLAQWLGATLKVSIDPQSLFDVHIKRMHEYKRQLLNLLHVVTRYHAILADPDGPWVPRTVLFAGKAASSYDMAKRIVHLINDVAATINADPRVGELLRVVFVPNYGVSIAELVIPAADLSEQISTAGTEASGTGNMKFAMNGALTIGTLDGANIEIKDRVGTEDIFIFGMTATEVTQLRSDGYRPIDFRNGDDALRAALDAIASGAFSPDEPHRHSPVVEALLDRDHYMLLADYRAYVNAQQRVDRRYRDSEAWAASAVRNVAGMGPFSSDRAIREYASRIWQVTPRR